MDIYVKYNIQYSHSSHETLSAPSVCPELYSYMHSLDLSWYEITFIELYTFCLLPTFTVPD